MSEKVLIATLGTEPQVVTLALDLLLAKSYSIAEVIILHTAGKVEGILLRRNRHERSEDNRPWRKNREGHFHDPWPKDHVGP
jgi:hypothetical protein